jgi:hypothetical protein
MKFTLIVFRYKDWEKVKDFEKKEEAEAFVNSYPSFGGELSKPIRTGDWQIVNLEKYK